jgi:hypothetical protein
MNKISHNATKVCNNKHITASLNWNLDFAKHVETSGASSAHQLGNNWTIKS